MLEMHAHMFLAYLAGSCMFSREVLTHFYADNWAGRLSLWPPLLCVNLFIPLSIHMTDSCEWLKGLKMLKQPRGETETILYTARSQSLSGPTRTLLI